MEIIFLIIILILSVIIHEISHGYAALALGDPTAKSLGRLTLNPIPHLDLWGSILIPSLMALSGTGVIFGWAKPVPYNPYNLKNQRWGEAIVAIAGPASNIVIAVIAGLITMLISIDMERKAVLLHAFLSRGVDVFSITTGSSEVIVAGLFMLILINLVLAVFNLVPIPPLDGSKILFSVLPYRFYHIRESLERYGFVLVLIFIFFLWRLITPIIFYLFNLIT